MARHPSRAPAPMTCPNPIPPLSFSRRTRWDLSANRLSELLERARAAPERILDLSETNPTRCGLAWPAGELAAALEQGDPATYAPDPRGDPAARQAIAEYASSLGASVGPDSVVMTASTSEAYSFLLKLLCDPGDEVLVPSPSYPLLDVLCQLESTRLVRYPLRYDGTWHIDLAALAGALTDRTRAVVVVSPSNPTGASLDPAELGALELLCVERGIGLIGDEVFADTALGAAVSVATCREALAFHLSGASKTCGLPQVKAGWIVVAGREPARRRALERLEMISDAFLSVSGPAQRALPVLLRRRHVFLDRLRGRLAGNRAALASLEAAGAPLTPLRSGGGWSAVLRIGETLDEESLCARLVEDGVIAHPGFFYDFETSGHLVVSLLAEPEVFREGIGRIATVLAAAGS